MSAQGGVAGCEPGDVNREWDIKAVLLDMDGTLLDTERVYVQCLIVALEACGYNGDTLTLCHSMIGLPGPECEIMLREHYGEDFPVADINRAFGGIKRNEMIEAGMPLKSGVVELLDAVKEAGYPMAIVTSSSHRTTEKYLALAGIRNYFEAAFTRDDVARGKPSPDLYLLAARRFGLKPQCCLAIEDSNPGVEAACAAGAVTIMVPDIVPPTEAARAKCVAVLPDLAAVVALLRTRGTLARS
jgi:HAD superfamily hydrolase (TIGR01509 family)